MAQRDTASRRETKISAVTQIYISAAPVSHQQIGQKIRTKILQSNISVYINNPIARFCDHSPTSLFQNKNTINDTELKDESYEIASEDSECSCGGCIFLG